MLTSENLILPGHLPFTDFIRALRNSGFPVGVDTYLNLNRVLQEYDPKYDTRSLSSLRAMLCPLFATNKEQQELFYHLFNQHFGIDASLADHSEPADAREAANDEIPENTNSKQPDFFQRNWILLTVLWLGTLLLIIFPLINYIGTHTPPEPEVKVQPENSPHIAPSTPWPETKASPKNVNPALTVNLKEQDMLQPGIDYLEIKNMWEHRFRFIELQLGLWLVLGLLSCYLIFEVVTYYNRKMVVRSRYGRPPPAKPVDMYTEPHISMSAEFFLTAKELTRRGETAHIKVDIPGTIRSVAVNGGFGEMQYLQISKPPSYLILIDRQSPKNQQTDLFELVVLSLERENVQIEKYYYDRIPATFRNDEHPGGVSLNFLNYHYPEHRLVFFGGVESFVDSAFGLLEWTYFLSNWKDRALLTTTPVHRWGEREMQLASLLVVLPATTRGTMDLAEIFSGFKEYDVTEWMYVQEAGLDEAKLDPQLPDFIQALSSILRAETRRTKTDEEPTLPEWVTACCLYPEISWDMTLFLGKALSTKKTHLLTQENLEKITALPWFRAGEIPEACRKALLQSAILSEKKKHLLADAIAQRVTFHLPEDERSEAYKKQQMNIALMQLALDPTDKKQKELVARLSGRQPARFRDYIGYKMVKKFSVRATDLLVPDFIKERIYKAKMDHYNIPVYLRAIAVAAILGVLVSVMDFSFNHGEMVTLDSKNYFIGNAWNKACFNTSRAAYYYNDKIRGNYIYPGSIAFNEAQEYLRSALQVSPAFAPALINQLVIQHNLNLVELRHGNFTEAVSGFQRELKFFPKVDSLLAVDTAFILNHGESSYRDFKDKFNAFKEEVQVAYFTADSLLNLAP